MGTMDTLGTSSIPIWVSLLFSFLLFTSACCKHCYKEAPAVSTVLARCKPQALPLCHLNLENSERSIQIHKEGKNQVCLLRAEDESFAFHKTQNYFCWASSTMGKLTRQREMKRRRRDGCWRKDISCAARSKTYQLQMCLKWLEKKSPDMIEMCEQSLIMIKKALQKDRRKERWRKESQTHKWNKYSLGKWKKKSCDYNHWAGRCWN